MAEWVYANPNPRGRRTDDCVIRAVSLATGQDWDTTYTMVSLTGYAMDDMPSMNHVWRAYLKGIGYKRATIPNTCPDCYTVNDFAEDNPNGTYILGCGTHAVCVKNGRTYDTFDSREYLPLYYYYKED